LLKAAEAQFNAMSFAEVSMERVAKTAGITGAAIYNHFASKDELFLETVKNRIQIYNQTINAAVAGPGSWKDKFNTLLEAVTPLQGNSSGFPMIGSVVINRLQQEPEKFREIRDLREESTKVFRGLIAEAVDCGDLPKNTNIVIAGDLLMAITAGATNTVSFYHPSLDNMTPIIDAVKVLLGTGR
jgi:AcrR family transcriptional regulator